MIDQINKALKELNEKIHSVNTNSVERDKQLDKSIRSVLQQQALTGQISVLEAQKQIQTTMFQKAQGYTNLVILAGYAGTFAIWQLTKKYLPEYLMIYVGILLGVSIILFVGYEVYKSISYSLFIRRLDNVLRNYTGHDIINGWNLATIDYANKESRIWVIFLIPTILTGFGAGGLLMFSFINHLLLM